MGTSRRGLLAGAGVIAATAPGLAAGAPSAATADDAAWLQSLLETFASFGVKASATPGDEACGAWLEKQLTRFGYACDRQPFDVPFATIRTATLGVGDKRAPVFPQPIVEPTGPGGITGPIRRADVGGSLEGAIALLVLPSRRWVSTAEPMVARGLADAFQRGAAAVVVITNGPTGELIGLNVSATKPGWPKPVALLAPKDAEPFLTAAVASATATLVVDGEAGKRSAYNLIGRLDRGADKTLIISTPRSGWFTCASERGAGVAVWLSVARWLAATKPKVNVELAANSGHEYIYLGGEEYLEHRAPKPDKTHMWVHIGASAAARDWHELAVGLRPLPSADAQRVLVATPTVIDGCRKAFKGVTGLEAPYPADRTYAGGEIVNVIEAGYSPAIGLYGGHRFFHTPGDDMRCVSGELVAPVAAAFKAVIAATLP